MSVNIIRLRDHLKADHSVASIKNIIREYNLQTKIVMSKNKKALTKAELIEEIVKHLEMSDDNVIRLQQKDKELNLAEKYDKTKAYKKGDRVIFEKNEYTANRAVRKGISPGGPVGIIAWRLSNGKEFPIRYAKKYLKEYEEQLENIFDDNKKIMFESNRVKYRAFFFYKKRVAGTKVDPNEEVVVI
jgi:hypothetical protein